MSRLASALLFAALLAGTPLCATSEAGEPQAAASRSIVDASGRRVVLPRQVNRVAVPWHANNAMVMLLGGGDKIVATTSQAQRQPWLRKLLPRIAAVPAAFDAAGDVNLESLIGARPDVVLMAFDGSEPRWTKSRGIPIVLMPNTSLEALQTTAMLTGQVLGEAEARVAVDYVRLFRANVARVESRTRDLAVADRPKVLHTASAGVLTVDGKGTIVDDWIRVAGGVNAAQVTGNGRPVTLEQVLAWNPDVIIVGSAPNAQSRDLILADPRWRNVEAVKRGRVIVNPAGAYLWDRHSGEAALQVLWAAKMLHPALFTDIDIKAETRGFYARFFHYRLTDGEIVSILDAVPPP
jgi:iron complex transport system substrate-binding protein